MVEQSTASVSTMSATAKLRRSSWKADAIRRGDLKISGPIPITEETPLTEDEERDFAERHNKEESSLTEDLSAQHQAPQAPQINGVQQVPLDREDVQPELQEGPRELQQKRPLTGAQETRETKRRSSPGPAFVPLASPSPFPSIPDSSAKMSTKRKRKSGLRNVFRKMFGRRSREESLEQDRSVRGHSYHRSDPGVLDQSPPRSKTAPPSNQRISDLPVRELEPINPLGQHLPFPMNVNAPQEASPPHEYLTFEAPHPNFARRRATLPSVLLTQDEAQAMTSTWGKHEAQTASPQIGIALSSPSQPLPSQPTQPTQQKRRSRSAGALREAAKERPSVERRRSAEIKYWRSSYQSGSIYSQNTPRPRTAQTVESARSVGTMEPTAEEPMQGIVESHTVEGSIVPAHDQDISQIELPVEVFNFGNLRSNFSDDEHHEEVVTHEGVVLTKEGDNLTRQETPEVPVRSQQRLSIEDRVKDLEDNMRVLETSVHRLSGRSNRQTIILENVPKGRRSRNRSASGSERPSSTRSRSNSTRTLNVKQEESPTLVGPLSAVSELPSSTDRPQTVIAIEPSQIPRPVTSTSSRSAHSSEQVAHLHALLNHEREARKTLEKQVDGLQREVADLHALVHKFVRTTASPTSYPTPSPDGIMTSNEERLTTPRASESRAVANHGLGVQDGQDRNVRETIISRFSQSDSERGDQSLSSSREDITSPDIWATPKEESAFGSGFFNKSKADISEKENMPHMSGEDEMF